MIIIYNGKRYQAKNYDQIMPGDFYMAADVGKPAVIRRQPGSSQRSGSPISLILEEAGDSHKEAADQIRHWKDEAHRERQHGLILARHAVSLYDTLIALHHALVQSEYAYIDGNTAGESIPPGMLRPMFDCLRDILQEAIDNSLPHPPIGANPTKGGDCAATNKKEARESVPVL